MTVVSFDDLTDEQRRAVRALDRNVTLTAGAGTGKTTTLTARYVEMIERSLSEATGGGSGGEPLGPENVLTTTFTERAANDLEASVREEITDRIASLDVEEFDAWRTVADELERGYIHTLHGFCARLLREHALTIDAVDPGFQTLDENESQALVHETVGDVLETHETDDAARTLARRFSRRQLQDVLTDLLAERPESLEWADRWANATAEEYVAFVESTLHPIDPAVAADRLADPDFVDAVDTLRAFVDDPPDIDTGGKNWERAEGVVAILDTGFDDGIPSRGKQSTITELSIHLTTGAGDRYAGYTGAGSRWGEHPRKAEFDEAFETLVDTLGPEEFAVSVDLAAEADSFRFVRALAELTQVAAAEYDARKARQNAVDFSDLLTYTVDFLAAPENATIREELREQFAYVMVDEFQDTDPRQWDLITLLTASDGETFDAENVFVVGDVKQSIYRFRNADVTQFRETAATLAQQPNTQAQEPNTQAQQPDSQAQEPDDGQTGTQDRGSGPADDQLSTNFRTLPTVLESINELFDAVFDDDGDPYEAAPQPLTADRDDPADLGSVEYLAVPTDPEIRVRRFDAFPAFATADPEHDAELEAIALAARLSQVLAEPLQVYPEEDESAAPRSVRPDDVAVLIRSRTHLKTYERALEEAGVPYSVASGVGFYESTEITALVNLFRALADPGDERALYAALRSPLFGFTDDSLARLKRHGDPLWDALAASEHEELQDAYGHLTEWRERAGLGDERPRDFVGSWAAFLGRILEETGYWVSVTADERPQQAVANVEKFREQLRGWSDDGVLSLTTVVNRIERRIELGGRESEADTAGDGVQIMTIHDAKGMEFPVVAVPGIGHGFNDKAALGDGKVEFERVGDQHVVGMKAPNPADPFELVDTIARETVRERRRAEERAEEKRVLYVACTRARDHLLLSCLHDCPNDAEPPSMADLADPNPASASSWRDWVQPELLTDDVCVALTSDNHVRRQYGDGAYTVSLPTPPVEQDAPEDAADPAVELSPRPPEPAVHYGFSATDLATLFGEYGELRVDDDTNALYVEETDGDESSPERRHAEAARAIDEPEPAARSPSGTRADPDEIDATVFGQLVHRLCELRPPESEWVAVMEQALAEEGVSAERTAELEERVRTHARRGIDFVDEQAAGVDVEHRYDELYVTAEFEHGEISGFIDNVLVTPDAYHVIDYKTGDVSPAELEADAGYYETQLQAYAVALNQQGTGRSVRVSLVFTALDEAWEAAWSPADVETMTQRIDEAIWSRYEALESQA